MTDEGHKTGRKEGEAEPGEVRRLRRLARLLDSSIRLPGGFRVGLDGFIGLVPFVGDAVGASLSTYIIVKAAQLGGSTFLLVRMMMNVLLETLVGVVPVIGDLFDFAWKANDRNMALLDRYLPPDSRDAPAKKRLTTAVLFLIAAFILLLALLFIAAVKLLIGLIGLLA